MKCGISIWHAGTSPPTSTIRTCPKKSFFRTVLRRWREREVEGLQLVICAWPPLRLPADLLGDVE